MTSIFQGVAAPNVTTDKTVTTTAPEYYTDYLSGIASAGKSELGKSGTDIVADMTPLQLAGISGISGAALSYQPGISGAAAAASTAAGGLTPENIQAMMNPFQTGVVNEMGRLSQQNLQRNLLPALKGAFTSTGGLGGQRMMGALGQMGADVQANLTGLQTKELETGYQNAVINALKNLEQQRLGATTEADIAAKAQELGLTGQNAMIKAGALEQAQKQAVLDAPIKRAADVAALMKNYQVPSGTAEHYTGPMAGVYGTSPLAQLTGLGTLLSALNTAGVGSSGVTPLQNILRAFGYSGTLNDADLFNINRTVSNDGNSGSGGGGGGGGGVDDGFGNDPAITGGGTSYTGGTPGGENSYGQYTGDADQTAP